MRSGEKKILHYIVNFADKMIELLKLNQSEVRKLMKKDKFSDDQTDYIKRTILPLLQQKEQD